MEKQVNNAWFHCVIFQIFKSMRIGQIRDPSSPPADQLPESYHTKVSDIVTFASCVPDS